MAKQIIFFCWLTILGSVAAFPCEADTKLYKKEHCVPVTPDREAEIQEIVSKMSNFVDSLALEHEYYDIRLLKFSIERHTADEVDEKHVEIQVNINDCPTIVSVDKDNVTDSSGTVNSVSVDSNTVNSTSVNSNTLNSTSVNSNTVNSDPVNSNTVNSTAVDNSSTVNSTAVDNSSTVKSTAVNSNTVNSTSVDFEATIINDNTGTDTVQTSIAPLVKPELVSWHLDQNGHELVEKLRKARGRSKPLLVYMQSGKQYAFLNK